MAITKEQALIKVSKARLQKRVAFALYIDHALDDKLHTEMVVAEAKYYAMLDAFYDSGLLTYDDTSALPDYKISHAD